MPAVAPAASASVLSLRHPHLLNSLVVPLASLAIAAAAYLLGSIPTGYLLVRIFRRQDIRSVGSGNIGATNVLRTGGKGLGAATFLLDVLKGSAAVWLGGLLGALLMPTVPLRDRASHCRSLRRPRAHVHLAGCAFAAAKALPPASASSWSLRPGPRWPPFGVFAVVFAISRIVSIASILGAASFPVFAWFLVTGSRPPVFFAVQCTVALLIVVKHHTNIRRLFDGTESRFGAKNPA